MARANIARIRPDGSGHFIYLHYGEPLEYGSILLDHYQDEAKIQALMDLGALSTLGPDIGQPVDFDTAVYSQSLREAQCLAYHRDWAEPWEDCQPKQLTGGLDEFRTDRAIRRAPPTGELPCPRTPQP